MSGKLVEKSCVEFAEALASKMPTPGGGGAAALCGALGTALCSMVGNFTTGRKKYAAVEEDIKAMLSKAERIRQRLLELIDEDAAAFEPLAKAYSIPKEDPKREEILERATLDACRVPLEMMHYSCMAVGLLDEMREKGSVMLMSDVACGALFCKAALESAAVNVFVNTKTLRNRERAAELESDADDMLRLYSPKAQKIADEIAGGLR